MRNSTLPAQNFDWPSPFSDLPNMGIGEDVPIEMTPQDSHTTSTPTQAAMLATLFTAADDLYTSLPGDELYHVSQTQAPYLQEQLGRLISLQNTLETFMQLLQQLEMLYPLILERATARDLDFHAICEMEDCIHHLSPLKPSTLSRQPNQFDYTLIQLLLSCHQRVLDISETILEHGAQCYNRAKDKDPDTLQIDVPDVRIGALMLSKPTAASVWMNMLHDSLIALQKQLRPMAGLLAAVRSPAEEETEVIQLQSKIIRRRTEAGAQALAGYRKALIELDLLIS